MLDRFTQSAPDTDLPVGVKSLVILALWGPPILVLWGFAIAVAGLAYRIARYGALPDLSAIGMPLDPTLVGLAVAGGIGYLYLMLANETFGEETVEAATEQAQELREGSDDTQSAADAIDKATDE